ncbi:HAD family hydrolase [soil metagenome]
MKFSAIKTVFVDADDTLWENNIFFLQSLAWLCREGRKHGHTDQATTYVLNHQENFNITRIGYGYDSYETSLLGTINTLVARSGRRDEHAAFVAGALRWTNFLRTHPIHWCAGVKDALPQLCERFRTIIVTKGHHSDQMGKVIRSGMKDVFHAAEVVPHKFAENYLALLKKYDLDPNETVMIGNSPRSDINMARAAGLRTVYIPHAQTWYRELEPIGLDAPATIEIPTFKGLLDILEG